MRAQPADPPADGPFRCPDGRWGMGVVGEVEVQEDGGENGRVSEKREDSHLAATGWAEQRKHVVRTGFILHLLQRMRPTRRSMGLLDLPRFDGQVSS